MLAVCYAVYGSQAAPPMHSRARAPQGAGASSSSTVSPSLPGSLARRRTRADASSRRPRLIYKIRIPGSCRNVCSRRPPSTRCDARPAPRRAARLCARAHRPTATTTTAHGPATTTTTAHGPTAQPAAGHRRMRGAVRPSAHARRTPATSQSPSTSRASSMCSDNGLRMTPAARCRGEEHPRCTAPAGSPAWAVLRPAPARLLSRTAGGDGGGGGGGGGDGRLEDGDRALPLRVAPVERERERGEACAPVRCHETEQRAECNRMPSRT
jgi:hypothetical protein